MGGVRVDANEELKFLYKFKKKRGGGPGESGGRVGSGGVRVDVNKIEVFVKIQKKNGWWSRGGGRGRVQGVGWM